MCVRACVFGCGIAVVARRVMKSRRKTAMSLMTLHPRLAACRCVPHASSTQPRTPLTAPTHHPGTSTVQAPQALRPGQDRDAQPVHPRGQPHRTVHPGQVRGGAGGAAGAASEHPVSRGGGGGEGGGEGTHALAIRWPVRRRWWPVCAVSVACVRAPADTVWRRVVCCAALAVVQPGNHRRL